MLVREVSVMSPPELPRVFTLTLDEDEIGVLNTMVVKALHPQDILLQMKTTLVLNIQKPVLNRVMEKMVLLVESSPKNNPHGRTVDAP